MGNKPSWVLFGLLGLALLYLAAKFLGASLHLSFCLCLLAVAALATIAFTNPFSAGHLLVFGGLCCMIPVWLMGLHLDLGGWKLPSAAALCIVGICTCTANLGIGERIVLLGALFGLNSVFYEHVLV
ncbi:MAG TPA: hypothetical protein VG944_20965 [Fimbriimonas sp.]|nr:hypothetical protein [Fimbriimonas sp.]